MSRHALYTPVGGFRTDLVITGRQAPPGTPVLDALLWGVNVHSACRLSDEIRAAADHGIDVDPDGAGPVFPDIRLPFLGAPSALGSLTSMTHEGIRDAFQAAGLPMPRGLRDVITTGAMLAGNADQALGYLLRWVGIAGLDDDE